MDIWLGRGWPLLVESYNTIAREPRQLATWILPKNVLSRVCEWRRHARATARADGMRRKEPPHPRALPRNVSVNTWFPVAAHVTIGIRLHVRPLAQGALWFRSKHTPSQTPASINEGMMLYTKA